MCLGTHLSCSMTSDPPPPPHPWAEGGGRGGTVGVEGGGQGQCSPKVVHIPRLIVMSVVHGGTQSARGQCVYV